MKKSIISAVCATAIVMTLGSCASYEKQAPIMSLSGTKINTYVAADLDYDGAKKVTGTINKRTLFGFIALERNGNKRLSASNRYKGLKKIEQQALYRAKENADVDMILDPEFESEKHKWFFGAYKKQSVRVTGWGVNVKGIKEDKHGYVNTY